jgi:hypothetical protein
MYCADSCNRATTDERVHVAATFKQFRASSKNHNGGGGEGRVAWRAKNIRLYYYYNSTRVDRGTV